MPRDNLNIERFDLGIISNADIEDIPLEAALYSKNQEPDVEQGMLTSIKTSAAVGGAAYAIDAARSAWIQNNDTTWALVNTEGSAVKSVVDFYGTPSEAEYGTSITGKCLVSHNREVHIGTGDAAPQWLGYIDHNTLGGTNSGLILANAECSYNHGTSNGQVILSALVGVPAEGAYFKYGKTYYYAYSLIYDGYQESPLYFDGAYVQPAVGYSYSSLYVPITIHGTIGTDWKDNFPKRVTAVNIYRAEGGYDASPGVDSVRELFRLAGTLDTTVSAGWTVTSTNHAQTFTDYGTIGVTYEASTGIPETYTSNIMKYSLSVPLNGYLFTAKNYDTDIPDAMQYIFRSKAGRFDMFDKVNDNLRLSFIPTALLGYYGKLYVFGKNRFCIIDPDQLYIEDEFIGKGCYSDKTIYATDYGIFWADINGAYYTSGNGVTEEISLPIKSVEDSSYKSWDNVFGTISTDTFSVVYSAQKKCVLFSNTKTGITWVYHIFKKKWYYWELSNPGTSDSSGLFVGKDGEVYYSTGAGLYKLYAGTNYEALIWVSKKFHLNKPSENKKWYKVITEGSGITTTYGVNGAAPTSALTNNDIATNDRLSKLLQIKLVGSAGVTQLKVYSVEIIARILIGAR